MWGTDRAASHYGLGTFKTATGDVAGTMRAVEADARGGWTPKTDVAEALPDWLTDPGRLATAASEEASLYEEIARFAAQLSDARQRARIALLERLQSHHDLLIAYDRSLITLEHLKRLASQEGVRFQPLVVTGARGHAAKRRIKRQFALGSDAAGIVALCSDAMSEGVNLQQASAVVFLDAPSVIRLAEQRVGRVDRMDSPHAAIDVYWPHDSPAFSLRSSRRFVERYLTVDRILGSNMPLPEELLVAGIDQEEETIGAPDLIATYERRQSETATWDGLHDAFQPVRNLVRGPSALLAESTYDAIKSSQATVLSEVSLVQASRPWAFFAIRGTETRAPRWVLVEQHGEPITELEGICAELRQRLDGAEQLPWSDGAAAWVERLLLRLRAAERSSLPNRRRHALDLMAKLLAVYRRETQEAERLAAIEELQAALAPPSPHQAGVDLYELAQAWLDLVRPVFLAVQDRQRRHPLRLKSRTLFEELRRAPIPTADLQRMADRIEAVDPLERRVAACIVGVPTSAHRAE